MSFSANKVYWVGSAIVRHQYSPSHIEFAMRVETTFHRVTIKGLENMESDIEIFWTDETPREFREIVYECLPKICRAYLFWRDLSKYDEFLDSGGDVLQTYHLHPKSPINKRISPFRLF
ncbi:hypothetical protein IQ250_04540 [Pseudanabaenaceae cyanobacterium LEGE 13415]|nr:hypothetical protein [Pseudanabaenaceae cyanobacterium LEGE 13415]